MEFLIEDRASRLFYNEKNDEFNDSLMAIRNKATVHIHVLEKRQLNTFTEVKNLKFVFI